MTSKNVIVLSVETTTTMMRSSSCRDSVSCLLLLLLSLMMMKWSVTRSVITCELSLFVHKAIACKYLESESKAGEMQVTSREKVKYRHRIHGVKLQGKLQDLLVKK